MSNLTRKPPVLPEELPSNESGHHVEESPDGSNFRLHPLSGLLLMVVDDFFWGVETLTLELALPISVVLSFGITLIAVTLTQKFLGRDGWGRSLAKAFFCAVLAGIPMGIMGTAVGGFILMAAGLSHFGRKGK